MRIWKTLIKNSVPQIHCYSNLSPMRVTLGFGYSRAFNSLRCTRLSVPSHIALYKPPTIIRPLQFFSSTRIVQDDQHRQTKPNKKSSIIPSSELRQEFQATTKKNIESILPKHENIYTIPNLLTFTRIATTPAIGYFLCNNQTAWAMSIFVYSCVTDFVDGFIARKYNMGTVLGSVMDPMADKFLMTVCTVSLSYASTMPLYMASLIIGRDVMLGFMAIYYRYISLPAPKTFVRYWDFSIPSASVHPTRLSKWNTGFQMIYIGLLVMKPGIESLLGDSSWVESFQYGLTAFEYLVASTTIISGGTYLFSKDAVKFVNK